MPTQTFTTICPCFPGFYESFLSLDGDQEQTYLDIMKNQHPDDGEKYVPEVHRGKDRVIRELADEMAKEIAEYAS